MGPIRIGAVLAICLASGCVVINLPGPGSDSNGRDSGVPSDGGQQQTGDGGQQQTGDGGESQNGDGGQQQTGDGGESQDGDGGHNQTGDGGESQDGDGGQQHGNTDGGVASLVHHLQFSCLTYNIGVLADATATVQIPCNASVTDNSDQLLGGAEIHFLAEAGTMKFASGNLFYFPRDPAALHTAPRDVDPEDLPGSAEPYRTAGGYIHNPRDGLVTIMAYTSAAKSYVVDELALSEPYVDANDNQQFDDGENYVDLNNNGHWDAVQDDDPAKPHALWRKIKILWTGTLQDQPPVASVVPGYSDMSYLSNTTFTLSVLDENYNVVAANDPANDVITWDYSPQPDISLSPGQTTTTALFFPDDQRRLGMLMDSDFEFIDPTTAFNWELGGNRSVTVQDTMMCNIPLVSETFSVTGHVGRSLFVSPSGDPQNRVSETTIEGGGTLEPPPSSMCSSW